MRAHTLLKISMNFLLLYLGACLSVLASAKEPAAQQNSYVCRLGKCVQVKTAELRQQGVRKSFANRGECEKNCRPHN
ncbi:unnamed protein product [Cylicocyclus nassatus]|uniref:Secreted protein n=1 Tax=Cylicocyclus nassatus TaxID=53992 RepID=A0AA36M0H2_CYLNA|nr:unnamed protein product [Cylicocyclus nassatus]